jgi:heterodisulfide reductase subunit C
MTLRITDVSRDEEFNEKLNEISGEIVQKCMQCGTCAGGCPMVDKMDLTPRQIMLLSHYGMKEKVTDSNTVWLCATCNTCYARCPRGLEIPKIMEAIRQMALRENVNAVEPNDLPEEVIRDLPQIALVSCFRKNTS